MLFIQDTDDGAVDDAKDQLLDDPVDNHRGRDSHIEGHRSHACQRPDEPHEHAIDHPLEDPLAGYALVKNGKDQDKEQRPDEPDGMGADEVEGSRRYGCKVSPDIRRQLIDPAKEPPTRQKKEY